MKKKINIIDVLNRKIAEVKNLAIESNGKISSEEFGQLKRLYELRNICNSTETPIIARRWFAILAISIIFGIIILLIFIRVPFMIPVDMNFNLSELSFGLKNKQDIVRDLSLESISITSVDEIFIDDSPEDLLKNNRDKKNLIKLSLSDNSSHIYIDRLNLPADTKMTIKYDKNEESCRLFIFNEHLDFKINVNGLINTLISPHVMHEEKKYEIQSIRVKSKTKKNQIIIIFKPLNISRKAMFQQLAINEIKLYRTLNPFHYEFPKKISTILSGNLNLLAFKNHELKVRKGQNIYFGQSDGDMDLVLDDDKMLFSFSGKVNSLKSGIEENPKNLMPSLLEFLMGNHRVELLWTATFFMISLLVVFIGWWTKNR